MDADNDIYTSEVGILDQNGVHNEHPGLGEEGFVPEEVNEVHSTQEVEELTDVYVENNGSVTCKEVEIEETNQVKKPKPQDTKVRGKIEKPSNKKIAIAPSVKKINNSKEIRASSNGTLSPTAQPKQAVTKTRSFNDRHALNSNPSKTTAVEKSKLKPLHKGPLAKTEGNGESMENPPAADSKPRKEGKLPSYGFSFKCDERAEKRREFYTKLEEKIHAKEEEKSSLQAKSKETQEAEIRMFRKSLNFKATPMPSFYQEPPPPKVELKKIPPTRPRSPKLGRKKNSSTVDAEEDGDRINRPGRLSLDEKAVSQNKPDKGSPAVRSKRPQRNSLPRLPSEKTRLSKTQVQDNVINGNPPIARVEDDDFPLSDASQAQPGNENGPLDEDQAQPTFEQEGVAVEH